MKTTSDTSRPTSSKFKTQEIPPSGKLMYIPSQSAKAFGITTLSFIKRWCSLCKTFLLGRTTAVKAFGGYYPSTAQPGKNSDFT